MKEIERKMSEIADAESRQLFNELHMLTGVDPQEYAEVSVQQFLQQCIYPNGHGMPVKLTRDRIAGFDRFDDFILLKKVGKVGDGLHRLLRGLAATLETRSGTAVYMLLNQTLVFSKKKDPARYTLPRAPAPKAD